MSDPSAQTPEPTPQPSGQAPGQLRCGGCGAKIASDQKTCSYCGTHSDTASVPASAFCQKCGYALSGLQSSSKCPECAHPVIESMRAQGVASPIFHAMLNAEPEIPTTVPESALCRGCGYALSGLQVTDKCPECGRPVLESIRGDLLKFCDASYLKSLHRGVVLVETGLVMYLLATISAFGLAILGPVLGLGIAAGPIVSVLGLIPIATSFAGWFVISVPDPGVNLEDKGDKPRKTLRTAAIVNTSAAAVASVLGAIFPSASTSMWGGVTAGGNPIIGVVSTGVSIASLVAFVIQYFMAMKYLHWIAPRIPSYELASKMKKQTWLIALLYFPGCVTGIGPLISLILFYNLLDKFRIEFKRIRKETTGSTELWKDLIPAKEMGIDRNDPPAQPPNAS